MERYTHHKAYKMDKTLSPSLAVGVKVIETACKQLPLTPGVYRMISKDGDVLYVGKARALRKRVVSYTRPLALPTRLQRMIAETASLEVTLTHTEGEALLLESNMIKQLEPPYNILLRDDKSFAYLKLTDHPFPQLSKHRGAVTKDHFYFGPFASTHAVNGTLETLYRVFQLRSCPDTVFNQRKRPCLQYHIKRCTAPCVGYVSATDYHQQVEDAKNFLSNRSNLLIQKLSLKMQAASETLDYEQAAKYRDQIQCLSQIQQQQDINIEGFQDADIIALYQAGSQTCIQVFFFRNGCNFGNRPYFPRHHADDTVDEILSAFIMQFYQDQAAPAMVLLSHALEEQALIANALSHLSGYKVTLHVPERGVRRKVVDHAIFNAKEALNRRLAEKATQHALLQAIQTLFALPKLPHRIEVYDNSHLFGHYGYGAMIVAGPEGFNKKEYRKFKMPDAVTPGGDDYEMMREMMRRRFPLNTREESILPDLMIIDGGQGQLNAVVEVLCERGLAHIPVIGMAKGPDRNAGEERFFRLNQPPLELPKNSAEKYFLQRLRDEAHRFVIQAHRHKRTSDIERSTLDSIPGIGPKRKKALLHHFGSAYNVSRAGIEDLQAVEGIDTMLATMIYGFFHPTGTR